MPFDFAEVISRDERQHTALAVDGKVLRARHDFDRVNRPACEPIDGVENLKRTNQVQFVHRRHQDHDNAPTWGSAPRQASVRRGSDAFRRRVASRVALHSSLLFSEFLRPLQVSSLCPRAGRLRKGTGQRWRIVNHFCRTSIREPSLAWLQHLSVSWLGGQSKLQGETLWYRMVMGGDGPRYVRLRPRASLAAILDERADQALPDKVNGLVSKVTFETLYLKPNMLVNVTPEPTR